MDQLDKYIQNIVSQKITEPENLEEIMLNAIHTVKGRERIRKYKIRKTIITSIIMLFATTGIGFAGVITYEKIWKNPERYTYEEIQESFAKIDNVENTDNTISEEKAKQNSIQILNNLGYINEEIKSIELQKDINNKDKPFYVIKTGNNEKEGIVITLNANTGDLNSFTNNEFKNINVGEKEISNIEAEDYSEQILKDIGFTEKEYQFTECIKQQIVYNNKIENVWTAKYYKIYDGIYNPYEVITSNFVINDNKLEINSIIETSDGSYDNNSEVITEEQAKQIALNKEKEFTNKEIENISTEIGIRKMNSYIYSLERNIEYGFEDKKYDKNIIIDNNKVRKVWLISIIHTNNNENIENLDANERLKRANKKYYIDITTGEIIGGEEIIKGGI